MKRGFGRIGFLAAAIVSALNLLSCEAYLDKAPESEISEKDVFGNFTSFQGFIEEMYNCIADPHKALAGNIYASMYLDDATLSNTPLIWDDGNYWDQQWRFLTGTVNTGLSTMGKRIWPLSWYGIRKANIALSKLELMSGATQEERNLIEGQAFFFRGFFHFELMKFWGGLPYVDTVLVASKQIKIPKLTYRETALKAAEDFRKAVDLLPLNWDDTQTGKMTLGNNAIRAGKIEALGFLGKDLLYAASPMMNEYSTGSASYDTELCKQAAVALAEAIRLCDEHGTYSLEPWETRTDNFWVHSPGNRERPGGTEVIRDQTIYNDSFTRWTTVRASSPVQFGAGNNRVEVPTHNYVQNYGMANGLPLDDPASGYDPSDPWKNRDPRFYVDIVVDNDEMAYSDAAGPDKVAQLYTNGRHRGGTNGSVTGYFLKKYTPKGCNPWDGWWSNFQAYHPILRLADIYLMYAEAVLQGYGSPDSSAPGSNLTAVQAVNIVRNRSNVPAVDAKYTADVDRFMQEIMRERAVELAYEGHRWFDLRRWNLLQEMKYREKTAIDFDRGPDNKPINMRERVVVTRVVEKKNNWVPFPITDISLYAEFPQNPGW